MSVRTFAAEGAPIAITGARVTAPAGWTVNTVRRRRMPGNGTRRGAEVPAHAARYRVTVPADAPLTQPYFLTRPRQGDSYQWANDAPKGLPFGPPLAHRPRVARHRRHRRDDRSSRPVPLRRRRPRRTAPRRQRRTGRGRRPRLTPAHRPAGHDAERAAGRGTSHQLLVAARDRHAAAAAAAGLDVHAGERSVHAEGEGRQDVGVVRRDRSGATHRGHVRGGSGGVA